MGRLARVAPVLAPRCFRPARGLASASGDRPALGPALARASCSLGAPCLWDTCSRPPPAALTAFDPGPVPPELELGALRFQEYCAPCHGPCGTGEGLGPPLLDTLYLPERTSDAAVARAITRGARQKHGDYGAMPVIHRASPADIAATNAHLRWLQ